MRRVAGRAFLLLLSALTFVAPSMGATFSNVQVRVSGDPSTRVPELRAALVTYAKSQNLVEAGPDAKADRTIRFLPTGSWIAVYDQAEDGNQIAKYLSKKLRCEAVAIDVFDSDVAALTLFRKGWKRDTFVREPGHSGSKARSKRWQHVVAPGHTAAELEGPWGTSPVFAEQIVADVAPILGWRLEAVGLGHREFEEPGFLEHIGIDADDVTELRFRFEKRPAWEIRRSGAPALMFSGWPLEMELAVGDPLPLSVNVRSEKGPAKGFAVTLSGVPIEQDLLAIDRVRVVPFRSDSTKPVYAPTKETADGAAVVARFPDMTIPAATRGFRPWWTEDDDGELYVAIEGKAEAPGSGNLKVTIAPLGAAEDRAATVSIPVAVLQPARPTLRSPEAEEMDEDMTIVTSMHLRRLATPRVLFAFVVLDASPGQAAAPLASVLERWDAVIRPDGSGTYEMAHHRGGNDLETGRLSGPGLADSRAWKPIKATLGTTWSLSLSVDTDHSYQGTPGRGMSIAPRSLFFERHEEDHLAHLGLWYSLDNVGAERAAELEKELQGIVDDLAATLPLVQAFVGRWDWAPMHLPGATLYDLAANVSAQVTSGRPWATRYLRGVTETMWLGPDLITRLDGTEQIEAVAKLTRAGDAVRLDLTESADLDGLERALESLLPSRSDWKAAAAKHYGHPRPAATVDGED